MASVQKKFIRFTPAIDIIFLKEVVALNPFSDPSKWERVATETNKAVVSLRPEAKDFSERSVRERLQALIAAYVKEDMESLKRSGTEEEFSEREQLLQEIKELRDEAEDVKKEKKASVQKNIKDAEAKGEEVRRKAMEAMPKEPTPKKAKFDVGSYLEKKNELEERRLALEEKKLAAAEEERRMFLETLMKLANK